MHDALGVVESAVQVFALVPLEHVVLNTVEVPVVGGPTQRLDHLVGGGGRGGGGGVRV